MKMPPVVAEGISDMQNYSRISSAIQNFYKHKTIFITGGTGFLGKVIIEKLLRTTDVKTIYLLIRNKRGFDAEKRANEIFNDPLFSCLEKDQPKFRQKIEYILGDCSLPDLGISKQDLEILKENVQIVFHGAATVKFTEKLKLALAINVRGTHEIVKLCKEMTNLESFVHVSSAFANCHKMHIEEISYKLKMSGENACQLIDCLEGDVLDFLTPKLLGEFPNTYTFTKALAEDVVIKQASDLPVAIFRPGIVIPTYEEPLPGWIDNLNGPTSILVGISTGILRVLYFRPEGIANIVPADLCGNALIAVACKIPKTSHIEPQIYNFVPDKQNIVRWNAYHEYTEKHGRHIPLSRRMVWYPCITMTSSKLLYNILILFYHILPGMFLDGCLLAMRKTPRLGQIYKRIHKACGLLNYFIESDWTFETDNVQSLWNELSETDKDLYKFNMKTIDWEKQFINTLHGMRKYIMKEDPSSVPKAIALHARLKNIHYITLALLYASSLFTLYYLFQKIF